MIINDDIFNVLPTIKDCSQNLIFSDPPYALGSVIVIDEKDNKIRYKSKSDFMSKWEMLSEDQLENMFEEFYRVLKHGGFCCMWSLSRQHLPFLYYSNKAGFENLQSISSYFISSFPKAMDLSKMLDKHYGEEREVVGKKIRGDVQKAKERCVGYLADNANRNNIKQFGYGIEDITTSSSTLAKKYDGYKSSICPLKEVSETLLVFRKPFKYKSIISDIIAKEENNETDIHGIGINIGGNRVSTNLELERFQKISPLPPSKGFNQNSMGNKFQEGNVDGRYPSNLYLIDGFNYTPEQIKKILTNKQFHILENIGIDIEPLAYMIEEKQIEYVCNYLDKFEISNLLDEQSGKLPTSAPDQIGQGDMTQKSKGIYGNKLSMITSAYGDDGGCSRILHKSKYEMEEYNLFNYTTKVNSHEREAMISKDIKVKNFGQLGGANQALKEGKEEYLQDSIGMNRIKQLKNNHPTLKNMALQHKLINLFLCPKEDIKDFKILIPFCGVQSEYIPAMALGVPEENITGIEISKEYCEIGDARKEYWIKHNFYFKEDKKEKEELKNEAIKKDKCISKKLF